MFRTVLARIPRHIPRLQIVQQRHRSVYPENQIIIKRHFSVTLKHFAFEENVNRTSENPAKVHLVDTDDLPSADPFLGAAPKQLQGNLISRQEAVQLLSDELYIGRQACEKIFEKESKLRYLNRTNFQKVIELIKSYKIASETVEEFPWILAMQAYNLREKLEAIVQMKPKKIDDFIPLMRASNFRLLKILSQMENECDILPEGNRIYYMSSKLDLPPKTLCKYISSRLFMLEIPVQALMENLDIMLDHGISPRSIIRDLWAFRYSTESIKERLGRARKSHKTKIMPWMIRCPEPILQRSLRLAADEKKILGKNEDVYDYLSQRLGFDIETTKAIISKHPVVGKTRVTKIKEVLDYLLNEAGCTRYDIAQVPRILAHGLETTKRRLDELKSYGCVPSSLVIVCRSKREYQKFVDKWLETRRKFDIK